MKNYKRRFKEEKYRFNTKTTGMSLYDDIMAKPDYHKYYKGLDYKIVQMSPNDFMEAVRKNQGKDPYAGVNMKTVAKYVDQIKKGTKFDMPVLEYELDGWLSHEGRHRAVAMQH